MKHVYYKISIVVCALFFSVAVHAQNNLGVATGNWCTATSIYLNKPIEYDDSTSSF